MAQVERSTSTGGKKYLTDKPVTFTDLETGGSTEINGDNITTGSIKSSNYVVDTTGTKINLVDGTIDTKNFKVTSAGKVTATEIYLSNGTTKAIDTDGLLTNLQFISSTNDSGEFNFIGAFPTLGSIEPYRLMINANIPSNFTITEAKITYVNIPVYWFTDPGYAWGYVRALKAYKVTTIQNDYYLQAEFNSEFGIGGSETLSELSAAFGSGYTPSAPSTPSHATSVIVSGDIKASLDVGQNRIILKAATIPTTSGNYDTDVDTCAPITSAGYAILNILGYKE